MGALGRFTLALSLTGLAVPGFAQRASHGGALSPGQYGAVASHGAAPLSGGGSFPIHSYGPAPLGLRAPAAGYTGIDPGALRSGRSGRAGYPAYRYRDYRKVPVGYFFTPYYYPFLDYGDTGYDYPPEDSGADAAAQSTYMQNVLGAQVQQLSAEVEQLREQQGPGVPQAPAYNESGPPPSPSTQNEEPPIPPITIVLRNGQQFHVKNYAVMDQTFWDFTQQPARKIPVSSIDIPASTRATEASGAEFPQIAGS